MFNLAASKDEKYLTLTGLFSGNLTFGDSVLTVPDGTAIDPALGVAGARFVAKVDAETGAPVWAKTFPANGIVFGSAAFDDNGNVLVTGIGCGAAQCGALLNVDGETVWDFTPSGVDLSTAAVAYAHGYFYVTGNLLATTTPVLPKLADISDGLVMLAVDATRGVVSWAATIDQDGAGGPGSSFLTTTDDAIFLGCTGSCGTVRTTVSTATVTFDVGRFTTYNGGVAKISPAGVPLWTADLPLEAGGAAATTNAVYVEFTSGWADRSILQGAQTFGDLTMAPWGARDKFIAKIDSETGAGQWVLQVGGQGNERSYDHVEIDQNGDIYALGSSWSHPSYFNPLVVDSHQGFGEDPRANGEDLFIAKLRTSDEKLPSCKVDNTTVAPGFCFIENTCYAHGDPSRSLATESCQSCDAVKSQTSWTTSPASCLIDGKCYAHGASSSEPTTECQYCDVFSSTSTWEVRQGQYVVDDRCFNATWDGIHKTELPQFDWVVVDHGTASTLGFVGAITKDAVFSGGFALFGDLNATNFQTGASVTSSGLGVGGDFSNIFTVYDMFIVKTTLDTGEPQDIWTFQGTDADLLLDMSASRDDQYLAVSGLYSGNLSFGGNWNLTTSPEASVDPNLGLAFERFVAKISAISGDPVWARTFDTAGAQTFGATVFDDDGNVFLEGVTCATGTQQCVALLGADDGSILWQFDPAGTGITFNDDSYGAASYSDGKFFVAGSLTTSTTPLTFADGSTLTRASSSSASSSDAVVLVLDAVDGTPLWAATISSSSGADRATSNFLHVQGDALYVGCVGPGCVRVASTISDATVAFQGGLLPPEGAGRFGVPSGGGVAKLNLTTGQPLWTAAVPKSKLFSDNRVVRSKVVIILVETNNFLIFLYFFAFSLLFKFSGFLVFGFSDFFPQLIPPFQKN